DAWGTIGSVLLWFLLGYAFYSSMFAVAGAIVSRQEELQNTATPLNLLMIASFFVAFTSSVSGADTTLAKVSSFLPPVAPLVMPLRIAGGDAALWEIALSLGIMLVSIVAVVLLAARLYEGAILRTGARVKLGDAWRSGRRQPAPGRV
ncbi:MAG TPA: ABC transporter permease, partial [Actinomycetota bacterium]|nr:ABC transporter permease [Actinomycetota bacterium]